jgi:hypothetical protein
LPWQKLHNLEKMSIPKWEISDLNFDWIGSSLITIFVIATQVSNKSLFENCAAILQDEITLYASDRE